MVAFVKKLLPPHSQQLGLRRIKDTDIGVVSPYRKQCWKLNHKFRRLHYDGITVGTSEVFQGKEKPVMIVSTVRSGDSLGFVKEERVSNNFNLLICHRMKVLHFWQGFFCCFLRLLTEIQCDTYASKVPVDRYWWSAYITFRCQLETVHEVLFRQRRFYTKQQTIWGAILMQSS